MVCQQPGGHERVTAVAAARHVADVAAALAELRGETIATIAEVTTSHACRLFGLEP